MINMNVRELWKSASGIARARVELRGTKLGSRVRTFGPVLVDGRPGIEIGSRAVFIGGMLPTSLSCAEGAELVIGDRTLFNYGVTIDAHESVRIGSRCMLGSFVHVRDDDGRTRAPVRIEDDVWIAHGAIIEAGSTIGKGSVVSAGAVVAGNVPAGSLVVGNPAVSSPLHPDDAPAPSPQKAQAREPKRHSREEVRTGIIDWLDDTRCFGEAATLVSSDDLSLRSAGVLDSLGLLQLLVMLEEKFGVKISASEFAQPERQTMRAFIDRVVGK